MGEHYLEAITVIFIALILVSLTLYFMQASEIDKQGDELQRRERGLCRVWVAIKAVCPEKETAILDKAEELRKIEESQ